MNKYLICILLGLITFYSCSDDDDKRMIEPSKIVAIKLNTTLYSIDSKGTNVAEVVVPAGTNIEAMKTMIMVTNGKLSNFTNNIDHDLRKPFTVAIDGDNGEKSEWTISVISKPKLASLSVDDVLITSNLAVTDQSITVSELPSSVDITSARVSFNFLNGKLLNYENGTEKTTQNLLFWKS